MVIKSALILAAAKIIPLLLYEHAQNITNANEELFNGM